ncbi:MAG: hypothetical protein HW380_1893 [Magnetococcales bacterium]|nr:hypothetical protein [Magnetococcales bacterium]
MKLSLATLLLLLGGVPLSVHGLVSATVLFAAAGVLFTINLLAALWSHTAFRSQPGLLVFHAALFLFLGAALVSRLTYFRGAVELTEGETFQGVAQGVERGPWHFDRLKDLRFSHEGLTIDYGPGMKRGATRAHVRFRDAQGRVQDTIIGDNTPLVMEGYRFRTTSNKGFALVFVWIPARGGTATREIMHLPSYPVETDQVRHWRIPGTAIRTRIDLVLDETVVDRDKPSQFHLPNDYHLKLWTGKGSTRTLKKGTQVRWDEGVLVFEGLRTWMGYRIHYDAAMNWLLASCLMAVFGLAWHYHGQFSRRRWSAEPVK